MNRLFRTLLLCILLSACVHSVESTTLKSEAPSDIPDVVQLKMRVNQLYEAENKRDWYTLYNISLFSQNKLFPKERQVSYEKLKEDFKTAEESKYEFVSWSIKKITLRNDLVKESQENKEIEKWKKMQKLIKYLVEVEMDIVLKYNSNEPEKITEYKDGWIYIDNTWYWSGRGPH